ncbi:MAG: hypothetical protein MR314_06505 [Ezakiella sp.]|nr:hypothetical protein [Ezakiella sp.]
MKKLIIILIILLLSCKTNNNTKQVQYQMPVDGFKVTSDGVPCPDQIMINGKVYPFENNGTIEIDKADKYDIYLSEDSMSPEGTYLISIDEENRLFDGYYIPHKDKDDKDNEEIIFELEPMYYSISIDGEFNNAKIIQAKDILVKDKEGNIKPKNIIRDYEIIKSTEIILK